MCDICDGISHDEYDRQMTDLIARYGYSTYGGEMRISLLRAPQVPDPRADVARTVTILRLSPPRGGTVERAARVLLEIGWRVGYGPLDSDMAPFYVWAGMAM